MNKQPELPDFIRDLEIEQSLQSLNHLVETDARVTMDDEGEDGEEPKPMTS